MKTDKMTSARPSGSSIMLFAVLLSLGLVGIGLLLPKNEAVGSSVAGEDREEARIYARSSMEKVVITDFEPSHQRRIGKSTETVGHIVTLIGKHGLRLRTELSVGCSDIPIRARIGRIIQVRADYWAVRNTQEGELSDDDARMALCGDFKGRDVAQDERDGEKTGVKIPANGKMK